MGEVYRARDTRLARDVAVKVLPEHLSSSTDLRQRFEREAKVVAQLSHPHICALHDVGTEGDRDYLVMDYLEGESLSARLAQGPLPIREAVIYGIQIAEALEHAHHAGVIHRDLKPGNVFLTNKGVKVLDFGLARWIVISPPSGARPEDPTQKATGPQTTPGTILGTLSYMSPEQLQGKDADARSDIFAFGATLYEMMTGRPAFSGATRVELMTAIMRDEPRPLTEVAPVTPPALERLVHQCLAKSPDDRWEAAHDLTNALRWIRDEMSAPAVRKELPRQIKGNRRAFALAGATLAVVATALLTYYLLNRPAAPPKAAIDSKRIAVLPFENQGQASEEYFSDGVSDEVRGKLASLPGIEVIARGSSIGYKKASNLKQVAKELSVGYLLTGTVRWENPPGQSSRVHISPELVEVRVDGPPIMRWQQNFDTSLTDVFEVQAGIAGRVAQAMNVVLAPPAQQVLAQKPTHNLEAWEAYLRGQEISPAFSDPSMVRKSIAYYEHAVELDPGFARAWATLSRAHSSIYENAVPSAAEAEASRKAADWALALAPNRPESLLADGYYHRYVTKDYVKTRESFEKAFRLAPAGAEVLVALADLDIQNGRREDAVTRLKLAQRLDPRSERTAHRLVMSLLCVRRYQEALVEYDRGLGFAPRNLTLIQTGAMAFLAQGNLSAAREALEQAARNIDRKRLAVFMSGYSDLYWALSPSDGEVVLRTTADAFDGDLSAWAIVQTEILWSKGETEKAREFAKKASSAAEALLKEFPADSARHALLGLAYAYQGLREQGIAEALKAIAILPLAKDADRGAYIQLQLVRVYLLLGEPEKALDSLEPLLKIPFYVTPGWLTIDPTFDSLRGNSRFQRLLRQGPNLGDPNSSTRARLVLPGSCEFSMTVPLILLPVLC